MASRDAEFAAGIGLGLLQAVRSDPDVFLTAVYGVTVGARKGPLKGLSSALGLYIVYRMVSQSFGMNLARMAAVMEREAYWNMQASQNPTSGAHGYAI